MTTSNRSEDAQQEHSLWPFTISRLGWELSKAYYISCCYFHSCYRCSGFKAFEEHNKFKLRIKPVLLVPVHEISTIPHFRFFQPNNCILNFNIQITGIPKFWGRLELTMLSFEFQYSGRIAMPVLSKVRFCVPKQYWINTKLVPSFLVNFFGQIGLIEKFMAIQFSLLITLSNLN